MTRMIDRYLPSCLSADPSLFLLQLFKMGASPRPKIGSSKGARTIEKALECEPQLPGSLAVCLLQALLVDAVVSPVR